VADVDAEATGVLFPLAEPGTEIAIGAPLAVISAVEGETAASALAWAEAQRASAAPTPSAPPATGATATQKAIILAEKLGIDLAHVAAAGDRITEQDVRNHAAKTAPARRPLYVPPRNGRRLLLLGAGMGVDQLVDALGGEPDTKVVGLLDDAPDKQGTTICGAPVIGRNNRETLLRFWQAQAFDEAVVTIGASLPLRQRLFELLRELGVPVGNVVHHTAHIGRDVRMGTGNLVLGEVHVGPSAELGDNCFISSLCSIEHHCRVGSHCTFGPGVLFSGCVEVGDSVKFGTGVFVEPKLHIGAGSLIASGVVLTRHVPPSSLVKSTAPVHIQPRR